MTMIQSMYNYYKRTVESILGYPLNMKSRQVQHLAGRMCIAYQMVLDGNTTTKIGDLMGKNHSTVSYLHSKMVICLNYPKQYKVEAAMWSAFQDNINKAIETNGSEFYK